VRVTVVLQRCYSGVTVVVQWRYSYVTMVLQWCRWIDRGYCSGSGRFVLHVRLELREPVVLQQGVESSCKQIRREKRREELRVSITRVEVSKTIASSAIASVQFAKQQCNNGVTTV
jgi:hypothetical protein